MLADNPALGRTCDDVRPSLRRMEIGRHVVFYREGTRGNLVSRILHRRMLPKRHVIDAEDNWPLGNQNAAASQKGGRRADYCPLPVAPGTPLG